MHRRSFLSLRLSSVLLLVRACMGCLVKQGVLSKTDTAVADCALLAGWQIWCIPWVRHLWTDLGLTPASRHNFRKLLEEGYTTVLIPGGVQECLHMEPGSEVAPRSMERSQVESANTACSVKEKLVALWGLEGHGFWSLKVA
jgi:hypothetical protein